MPRLPHPALSLVVLSFACTSNDKGARPGPDRSADTASAPTSDTPLPSEDTGDSSSPTALGPPVIVVAAGGGAEGEIGEDESWSARLYGQLLDCGDVTGDGLVRVAVLSTNEESDWLLDYFRWLGADEAENLHLPRRADAEAAEAALERADILFLKGGDQGIYYDEWNETPVEAWISALPTRGGGLGGTSAGAMSLAEWALAGGEDLISSDVLADARTRYLNDRDGGSGLHGDFFGVIPGVTIDTHTTQRGRLGRQAGVLAKAITDHELPDLLSIGLDERTGIAVRDGRATVVGVGAVDLLQATGGPLVRPEGRPLVMGDVRYDRLTDGWSFSLPDGRVDEARPPAGASPITATVLTTPPPTGWAVNGVDLDHEDRFSNRVIRSGPSYALRAGADDEPLSGSVGVLDAHTTDWRGIDQEAGLRALHDLPGATLYLMGAGGSLREVDGRLRAAGAGGDPELATLLITSGSLRWRGLSASVANSDLGDGRLQAAALIGLELHVLGDSDGAGYAWDAAARQLVAD